VKVLVDKADVLIVLGSQNSSNSRRLMEMGAARGIPGYLVDGASELQLDWFTNAATVAVTAGASAPEVVVQECLDFLKTHFNAVVSDEVLREENVHFAMPRELLTLKPQVPASAEQT
jgi:4-hydroxy-3-methylbut-2-enyl diphosphate reductase